MSLACFTEMRLPLGVLGARLLLLALVGCGEGVGVSSASARLRGVSCFFAPCCVNDRLDAVLPDRRPCLGVKASLTAVEPLRQRGDIVPTLGVGAIAEPRIYRRCVSVVGTLCSMWLSATLASPAR